MSDVARELGVSVQTVSLALKRNPKISEATVSRVCEAAERLGYRPNPLVSALFSEIRSLYKMKAPPVIGYISMHKQRLRWWNNGVDRVYYEGAKSRSEKLGFGFELFEPAVSEMSPKRFSEILRYRKVCGLICAPVPEVGMNVELDWQEFPAVAFGYSMNHPAIHRISPNHYQSMVCALQRLVELGYRRIGVIASILASNRTGNLYLAAYRNFQSTLPVSRCIPILFLSPPAENLPKSVLMESWSKEIQAWIQREKPDAIVNALYGNIDQILQKLRAHLLPDIAHVALSWVPSKSGIAGIDQNSQQIGKLAVDMLVTQVYANERGIPPIQTNSLVDGKWVDGASAPGNRMLGAE